MQQEKELPPKINEYGSAPHIKNIINLLNQNCYSRRMHDVFRDFVEIVLYVRSNGDKPVLTLRWAGEEKQLEAIAESFKDKLQESLSDDVLLSIGSFKLGR